MPAPAIERAINTIKGLEGDAEGVGVIVVVFIGKAVGVVTTGVGVAGAGVTLAAVTVAGSAIE